MPGRAHKERGMTMALTEKIEALLARLEEQMDPDV